MNQNLKGIFNNLAGNWSFHRKIHNLETDEINNAQGKASFIFIDEKDLNTLYYEESGIITLSQNSKSLNFHRKYIYKLQDDAIHIFLNDGMAIARKFLIRLNAECYNF